MDAFVIGVDVGTGSARAGVFTLDGERRGTATVPIALWRPKPEYAEQSSDDIWQAVAQAVRAAMAEAAISPAAVTGIGFDATCSLVALGANDEPVSISPTGSAAQNVIVWMDHRAVVEATAINSGGYDVLQYVGGGFSPEMEPPKLLWLKHHLPESYARTALYLDLADFLTYKATGIADRSLCTSVCKWGYLGKEGHWDKDFYTRIGLGDLFTSGRVSDTVRPLGEKIAPLTAAAAEHLGLTTACAVAVGIIDAHAGGLGLLGAAWEGNDVADPALLSSVLALIGGTSNCHMAVSLEPNFIDGVWGPYYGAMVPGLWLTEGGQSAAGQLIDRVIERGAGFAALSLAAQERGVTVYTLLNERLAEWATREKLTDVAPLTRDLHLLDYHLGNRTPHADPHARGVVDGLPLDASGDHDAAMYLAAIQAVAYGTRAIVETLNAHGFSIQRILTTGGGTKNPLWLQQHADATGLPITLGAESESVLLGAAVGAAAASGAYPSVLEAMRTMGRSGRTVLPNPAMRAYHDAKYAVYQSLYFEQLKHRAIMHAVS